MEAPIATNSLVLGCLPARNARYRPHHTAVIVPGQAEGERELRLDWREFDSYVNRYANARQARLAARPRATVLANSLERSPLTGRARSRAAAVPLSPLLRATASPRCSPIRSRVVVAAADSSRCSTTCSGNSRGKRREWLLTAPPPPRGAWLSASARSLPAPAPRAGRARRRRRPADVDVTSGTTGPPTAIQHTHSIRAMSAATLASTWRMAPESVVLHSGALVFNGAMTTMFPAFMLGATFVVHRAFDAEAFIATVERERVTHTMLVPSQIIAILNAPGFDPARSSLQLIRRGRAFAPRIQTVSTAFCRSASTSLRRGRIITVLDATTHSAGRSVGFRRRSTTCASSARTARPAGGETARSSGGARSRPGHYGRPDLTGMRCATAAIPRLGSSTPTRSISRPHKDMIDSGGISYPELAEIAARHPAVSEVPCS